MAEIFGTWRDDRLNGKSNEQDFIYAGSGDDRVKAKSGDDYIYGENGDDDLRGDGGNDYINGGDGDDRIYGGNGDDYLVAGNGEDELYGGNGNDFLTEGTDDGSDDLFHGGSGTDTFSVAASVFSDFSFEINLEKGFDQYGNRYVSVENIIGGNADDILAGDSADNWLQGMDGNDTIFGGDGDDRIEGGNGDDTLDGGAGDDYIRGGDGDDYIKTGDGWDDVEGGKGADTIDGGGGENDAVDHRGSDTGVTVNLETGVNTGGDAEGDTYLNMEFVYGSMHDDSLTGDSGTNRLVGRLGDDEINGGGGDDTLIGGRGADNLDGGEGTDTADYAWSDNGVTVHLGKGVGLGGDAHGDTLSNIENIMGSDHADKLTGDDGTNRLNGGNGDDILRGANGNDVLVGGAGADELDGGNGDRDAADYTYADAGVGVDLSGVGFAGEANGDTYIGIEYVYGSAHDDDISGDDEINRLVGNDGNDTLDGRGGNDYLLGGLGDDTMTGGDGADVYCYMGANDIGNDVITDFWTGAGRTDRLWLRDDFGIDNFTELQSVMSDTAEGVLITLTGGTILLEGLEVADLHADDFIF